MITIPKNVYEEMIAHAEKGYPNEACGLLSGPPSELQRTFGPEKGTGITQFFPMRNMDEASISYFMDPKEQLQVFKKMRELGLEMKGIFHSHVASEAFPSQKDIRLAFYPEASYLIVSLSDKTRPVLKSFRIRDEKVSEEEIKLV